MSEVFTNDTGCVLTRSHITGDVLCRWPGENCDCLMQRIDVSYAPESIRELELEFEENAITDAAEHLRENGLRATRDWINERITEVRAGDDPFDPEGTSLGNLEIARDRLQHELEHAHEQEAQCQQPHRT